MDVAVTVITKSTIMVKFKASFIKECAWGCKGYVACNLVVTSDGIKLDCATFI